jgi:hypothetical protein
MKSKRGKGTLNDGSGKKYKNGKITFADWFNELKAWIKAHKYPIIEESLNPGDWKDYYDDGYSPGSAFIEDMMNGL